MLVALNKLEEGAGARWGLYRKKQRFRSGEVRIYGKTNERQQQTGLYSVGV